MFPIAKTLAAAAFSLGLATAAQAVTTSHVSFTYDAAQPAAWNYAQFDAQAEAECRRLATKSASFVERVSRDHREACQADLLDAAVESFALNELTLLHSAQD